MPNPTHKVTFITRSGPPLQIETELEKELIIARIFEAKREMKLLEIDDTNNNTAIIDGSDIVFVTVATEGLIKTPIQDISKLGDFKKKAH